MGKSIVYCGQCGRSLPEDEFARGRAHLVDHLPYCTECRPLEPAPETRAKKPSSHRVPVPPSTTRRAAAPPRPPAFSKPLVLGGAAAGLPVSVCTAAMPPGGGPPPPPPPEPAVPIAVPKPPPVKPVAAPRGPDVELQMKAQKEKDQAAQLERFLAQIREIVTEGRRLAPRRAEIEAMIASALTQAGGRRGEVEKLREEFLRRVALTAHWKLDEAAGGTAEDATGNGHPGELSNGPARTTGRVGGALAFDGVDDGVIVKEIEGLSPQAGPAGEMTLCAWVRVSKLPSRDGQGRTPLAAKGDQPGWEYALYLVADGRFEFTLWNPNGVTHADVTGSAVVLDRWHHAAGVYQKGRASVLYVDGKEAARSTAFEGDSRAGASAFFIGRRGNGQYLAGSVDDVRLYSRALTAEEIKALFDAAPR